MTDNKTTYEEVETEKICCSGNISLGDGHPQVWLRIPLEIGQINCPYCEKIFILVNRNNKK
tara:strand:+ start:233 stop:415 length:183 start_codon:yes stop_codon:yes gene_type:complete